MLRRSEVSNEYYTYNVAVNYYRFRLSSALWVFTKATWPTVAVPQAVRVCLIIYILCRWYSFLLKDRISNEE